MNPLSGVLDEAWRMYKAHAKHLLAIAFVIYLAAAIIAAILSLAGTVGFWLGSLVAVIAAFLLQATLVKAVQDVRDGRADLSIGETVSAAMPSLGPVVGASILAGIAIIIGFILLIVPGLFLITIWAVIVPVIVIERSGALASFGRSRDLVRGRGWHVFATLVLVWVIILVANIVLGIIFRALPHVLGSGLAAIISGTLISPFLALVVTLVYYRLSGTSGDGGGPQGAYQQSSQDTMPYGGYQPPPAGGSYGSYESAPWPPQDSGTKDPRTPQDPQDPYGGPPPQSPLGLACEPCGGSPRRGFACEPRCRARRGPARPRAVRMRSRGPRRGQPGGR